VPAAEVRDLEVPAAEVRDLEVPCFCS